MNADRWQKLDEVFHAALEVGAAERKRFVARACGDDSELKFEVESMLDSHYDDGYEFLNKDALLAVGANLFAEMNAPQKIGEYKIIREIGRGGFGAVYEAAREGEFSQTVALKIIKRGMDTDEIIRRFRQERQILASLNHPFITRLLDGATTADGLPYLVMEYVEGVRLDEFCRARNLSPEEKFGLFRKICAAVAYAHRNLVIHRDLKPSNILITPDGEPKLLDFGIAKLLSEGESASRTATQIFTPEYASPEQKRGAQITTATDIYSLGVLLAELIRSGKSESENSNSFSSFKFQLPNWFRSVISKPPPVGGTNDNRQRRETASHSSHRLSPSDDVEKIIQMATREEPERRYASVGDFAEDIRRYQRGLPVAAQNDTFLYRAEKFVRRNLVGVAAAAIVLLSLVSGFSVAVWQARVAQIEREKAERRFRDVRALTNSFLFEFHDAIRDTAGTAPARRLVVTKALEYLNKLASEGENDLPLLGELAQAYIRVGSAQAESLKENENALQSFRTAVEIDRRILKINPEDVEAKRHLALGLFKFGEILIGLGRSEEAVAVYREAAAVREEISRIEPQNLRDLTDLAQQQERVGEVYAMLRQSAPAEEFYRRALQTIERRIGLENAPTTELSFAWINHGELLKQLKDFRGAAASYTKAAEIAEIAWRENPSDAQALRNLSASRNRAGDALDSLSDFRGALEHFKFSWNLIKNKAAENPTDIQMRTAEAYYTVKVAVETEKTGDKTEALRLVREGLALREKISAQDNWSNASLFYHAGLFEEAGDLLCRLGQFNEARKVYGKTLQIYSQLLSDEAPNTDLSERKRRLEEKILQSAVQHN
ncbi:MAG TPA: protein kinase [Pyrinomonadaceae bacterium]